MGRRFSMLIGVAVAAIVMSALHGAARAANVAACGQPITEDVTLTADLLCAADGLVVGADGVTIDLNGFTVQGSNVGVGVNQYPFANVTIENGTVSGFRIGVNFATTDVTIRRLTISRNSLEGIAVSEGQFAGQENVIADNVIAENSSGIITFGSQRLTISSNEIHDNVNEGIFATKINSFGLVVHHNHVFRNGGFGILVVDQNARIAGNLVTDNAKTGSWASEANPGIYTEEYSLANNVANRNGALGILVDHGLRADAGGNAAKHNGDPRQCVNIVCALNPS